MYGAAAALTACLLPSHFPSGLVKLLGHGDEERSDSKTANSISSKLHPGITVRPTTRPIIDSTLGGVALLDFDNDGYLDIFFTNGARIPGLVKENVSFYNRLYRNNHDGTFTDVTQHAGLKGEGYSMGVAAADFDNDGWADLYVTGVNRKRSISQQRPDPNLPYLTGLFPARLRTRGRSHGR